LKTNERMDEKDMEKEPNGKRKGWGIEIKMFFLGIAGLVSVTSKEQYSSILKLLNF
jgi:hypothetical protein